MGGQRRNPGLLTPEMTKLEVIAALLDSSTSRVVNERELKKILWGSRRKPFKKESYEEPDFV